MCDLLKRAEAMRETWELESSRKVVNRDLGPEMEQARPENSWEALRFRKPWHDIKLSEKL